MASTKSGRFHYYTGSIQRVVIYTLVLAYMHTIYDISRDLPNSPDKQETRNSMKTALKFFSQNTEEKEFDITCFGNISVRRKQFMSLCVTKRNLFFSKNKEKKD